MEFSAEQDFQSASHVIIFDPVARLVSTSSNRYSLFLVFLFLKRTNNKDDFYSPLAFLPGREILRNHTQKEEEILYLLGVVIDR